MLAFSDDYTFKNSSVSIFTYLFLCILSLYPVHLFTICLTLLGMVISSETSRLTWMLTKNYVHELAFLHLCPQLDSQVMVVTVCWQNVFYLSFRLTVWRLDSVRSWQPTDGAELGGRAPLAGACNFTFPFIRYINNNSTSGFTLLSAINPFKHSTECCYQCRGDGPQILDPPPDCLQYRVISWEDRDVIDIYFSFGYLGIKYTIKKVLSCEDKIRFFFKTAVFECPVPDTGS